jgi:LmbE family N-acetylglucosaminyl deacetylase/glycosyltransferase involved in cell wall biosynthesis
MNMLEEHDLIPFEPSALPKGPWLIFAPHPDDETFGMGGSIALAARQGIHVEVVVMTGGEGAGEVQIRREECLAAGKVLGVVRHHFWSLPDRGVDQALSVSPDVIIVLDSLAPKTVFLPGIQEFHPDHRATTRLIWSGLIAARYKGNVWLYEITRQNEANRLVDITSGLKAKKQAIQCYRSQLAQVEYEHIVLGLNSSRAYTLADNVTHAEAFWASELDNDFFESLSGQYTSLYRYRISQPHHAYPLISVIVRTKDRPRLLEEALSSLASQTYRPIEVIIVNDGGLEVPIDTFRARMPAIGVDYVAHERTRGRAAAANSGIHKASGQFVCFLDDDDLLYPQALETLISQSDSQKITYALAQCVKYGPDGRCDPQRSHLIGRPFERGRLILENYIAFNTFCVPRSLLEATGPLDEDLAIYEDWDLLIRLSKHYEMVFIDKLVAEYRVLGSATYTGKGGAERQAYYRRRVLAKHIGDLTAEDILQFVQSCVDRSVLNKEEKISLLHDEINLLNDAVNQKDSEIGDLREALHDRDQYIAQLTSDLQVLRNAENQLQEVLRSRSWRITKPIRKLKELMQRIQ